MGETVATASSVGTRDSAAEQASRTTGSDHTNVIGALIVLLLFNVVMAGAIWPSQTPSMWEDAPPEVEFARPPY